MVVKNFQVSYETFVLTMKLSNLHSETFKVDSENFTYPSETFTWLSESFMKTFIKLA